LLAGFPAGEWASKILLEVERGDQTTPPQLPHFLCVNVVPELTSGLDRLNYKNGRSDTEHDGVLR